MHGKEHILWPVGTTSGLLIQWLASIYCFVSFPYFMPPQNSVSMLRTRSTALLLALGAVGTSTATADVGNSVTVDARGKNVSVRCA
jgi:hypothetical protein